MNSIPLSKLINIIPGVVGTGGNPLALNAVMLTNDTSIPLGTVYSFSSADDVAAWFGAVSTEATLATTYFNGFDNKTQMPGSLNVAQYPVASVAAYLRGGSLAAMSLTALQALSAGTIIVTADGVLKTSTTITPSTFTSYSDAATKITTALSGPTCTWDAQRLAFKITSATTGASSTMTVATGTLAAALNLTTANGAVLSQGSIAAVPSTFMNNLITLSQNWCSLFTTWEPVDATKLLFSAWVNGQNDRYLYVAWDSSSVPQTTNPASSSFGATVDSLAYDGTYVVWPDATEAAFICGTIASIDFSRLNGRIDFAYKTQSGMPATVTDSPSYDNLVANNYNFHAAFASANDRFVCHQPGQIAGRWVWLDPYVNQIYLNAQLQLGLITMMMAVNSLPHNEYRRAMQRSACQPAIKEALNNGSIRAGIELSASQIAIINSQAGLDISSTLYSAGYYLQVLPATAQQRGLRHSGPMQLWYTDGGGIHTITMPSISIQ